MDFLGNKKKRLFTGKNIITQSPIKTHTVCVHTIQTTKWEKNRVFCWESCYERLGGGGKEGGEA